MAYMDNFHELDALRKEMDHIFDSMGGTWTLPFSRISFLPGRAARNYPLINVNEDKDAYYIEALAPGVDPDSMEVAVAGSTLSIAGEKNMKSADINPEAYHRNERAAGKFVRTIELPNEVDAGKVKADYKNGLILVTLPKSEKAKPKQISVNVA